MQEKVDNVFQETVIFRLRHREPRGNKGFFQGYKCSCIYVHKEERLTVTKHEGKSVLPPKIQGRCSNTTTLHHRLVGPSPRRTTVRDHIEAKYSFSRTTWRHESLPMNM